MENTENIVTKDLVEKVLKTVYDPEIPVDIYELGLIYDIIIQDKNVKVEMTLTAPNCPEAQTLPLEVKERVEQLAGAAQPRAAHGAVHEERRAPDRCGLRALRLPGLPRRAAEGSCRGLARQSRPPVPRRP